MMAVSTSETSVYFYEATQSYIPECSLSSYMLLLKKVKQSLYTPWRRLGGEKV
jgi:hypothetical protein